VPVNPITMPSGLEDDKALPETDGQEDAELLGAYLGGDEQAFEKLVKRYFGLVYSVTRRRLKDRSLAEEATQSTFIILARKAKALSNSVLLRAWLLKTAHFVCNDALKSFHRRQEHEEALEFHPEPEAPDLARDYAEVGEFLEQALLKLPAADQACLVARFFEGKTFKEMAGILGISDDLAQKKVSRGLQKLRRSLAKRGMKMSDPALFGVLLTFRPPPMPADMVHASLRIILPAARGKFASGLAVTLAARNLRVLARRKLMLLGAKAALALLLCCGGWMLWVSFRAPWPNDPSIERLGKDWSVVVLRAAAAKQTYQGRTPAPNTPEFAALMNELQFSVKETDRISAQLKGMLKPDKDRQRLAEFLTVEMRETLGLNRAQQRQLFNYIREGLSKGATLKEAMKFMAQSTAAEAGEVKAYLSVKQRQEFDRVYGADGLCLFQYLKVQTT
jgi:RNA polymerase sigma factor (sigma-70 family)